MSFFEGGRKTINQYTTTTNQQAGVQGSGNFVSTAPLTLGAGASVSIQSLDPLALEGMERTAVAAVNASQKYVEFASESNRLGLQTVGNVAETYAQVARDVAGTGLTPEQISANRGTSAPVSGKAIAATIAAVGLVVGLYYAYKKFL